MKEYFWLFICICYCCCGCDFISLEYVDIFFFYVWFVVKFWILQIFYFDLGRMINMYWGFMYFV